jgi:CRISPR-associated endonuclease/helicase Cas3
MHGEPTDFWAKLRRDGERVVGWHPLMDHCADVAACAEALLQHTILGRRLAALAGIEHLHPVQVARLGVLAALHDVGKYNAGFQNKALIGSFTAGHVSEIIDLLCTQRNYPEKGRLIEALALEQLVRWTDDEDGLADLLLATLGHHGRPVPSRETIDQRCWTPSRDLDPFAGMARLVALTRTWFPKAWEVDGPLLPAVPAFQHAWAGLLMLADWIGSDSERFFPFAEEGEGERMEIAREHAGRALSKLGLATAAARGRLGSDRLGYRFMGETFEPHPAQRRLLELDDLEGGSVVVLEAATGAGKTEAALAHFLRLFQAGEVDGLYFALPTRTAATQIYRRVCSAVAAAFPASQDRPPTVLAVPGYISVDGVEAQRLAPFQVEWPQDDGGRRSVRGWAAESSKRYLAGAVAVGTIDQVLLSSLTVSHAHMRSSALLRHLLVVDEVHASDVYMNRVLETVLDHHVAAGGHALLMSATLGAEARARLVAPPGRRAAAPWPSLDAASELPYPSVTVSRRGGAESEMLAVSGSPATKRVRIELAPISERAGAIAARALHAARGAARVLVIRNTVAGCREVQLELEHQHGDDGDLLFRCGGCFSPHHARYARADRRLLDDAIEAAFGLQRPPGGCVAAATQTVEQSLDLDADLLLTDLAPLDVLLQRIGRLHRHPKHSRPPGFETATVVVLVPEDRDLAALIAADGQGRGGHGIGTVYSDLRILEATWRCLEARRQLDLPRENRALVELATHPDALAAVVAEGGEAWERHQRYLLGNDSADRRLAELNRIDRAKSYADRPFPSGDSRRRIPTRLGEEDRMVHFAEPPSSPFGQAVRELTVPSYLARGVPAETESAERVECSADGFRFRFGAKSFRYDRLGLHPLDTESH